MCKQSWFVLDNFRSRKPRATAHGKEPSHTDVDVWRAPHSAGVNDNVACVGDATRSGVHARADARGGA